MFQPPEADQQLLLKIARDAVHSYLDGLPPPLHEISSPTLAENHGLFVSLHIGRQLRGCIGNIRPAMPLYRSVAQCAISAAFADPRFPPVSRAEMNGMTFEISILSAMTRIQSPDEIEIGIHGLLVSKRNATGILLPQVATAFGWDPERFLGETCRKAGLTPEEWKTDAMIHRFSAAVFSEHGLHLSTTS